MDKEYMTNEEARYEALNEYEVVLTARFVVRLNATDSEEAEDMAYEKVLDHIDDTIDFDLEIDSIE